MISDDFLGINACSMPAPGAKAEHIKQYLPGSTSEDDDILCLGAGTNNARLAAMLRQVLYQKMKHF